MSSHSGFPGANADREEASYVLLGAPLDVSSTFEPGSRFGPRRIRHYATTFDDYDRRTDSRFTDLGVHDAGDLDAWDDAEEYLEFLKSELSDATREGAVPLLLGGEHTVSVAGVRAVDPDLFVCLDAHLDCRAEYTGNEYSHATTTARALDVADRAVILGARTGSEAEWERASENDVTVVPPEAVGEWTAEFGSEESIYLSVDIDAADPGFAPGTGTKEPFGLTPRAMRQAIRQVAPDTAGFDVVEVNDRDDGQAAALAGKLLREFVYTHAANR
ncbi:agmatinase [Halobacteriales archaeon QS_3_64_16]|nr:MAG: agmatinase [Halobacteriales archaeon QS_3_64_16]